MQQIFLWDYRGVYSNNLVVPYCIKFSKDLLSDLEKLPESILNFISVRLEEQLLCELEAIKDCESPIEQLLVLALRDLINNYPDVLMLCQHEIKLKNTTYRVDICLYIGDWLNDSDSCKKLIVECDGHAFHEKTKEQAMRDKKRDRDLIEAGYQVIHFTGKEIFSDPYKCAREIKDLINKLRGA